MKILQILHGDQLGGMEKFVIDLSNALAKHHEVTLLCDPSFHKYCSTAVQCERLDIRASRNDPLFLFRLYRQITRISPDIIHLHKQKSIEVIKRITPFLKIPFVATKHDMQHKKAFYGLEHVVVISEAMKRTVKAKHLYMVYNGIPYIAPRKVALPQGFNIVAVGGLRPVKGFDTLILAVSRLSFPYHLTIIGEGSERKRLEASIKTLGLEEKVTLAGFRSNVQDYLYSADLQVISSHSEGFSLAMVEGIFYAPSLISTPVSGATDILPRVLLYEPEAMTEKIEAVYKEYAHYKAYFSTIKGTYQDALTIEGCTEAYIDIYHDILKEI